MSYVYMNKNKLAYKRHLVFLLHDGCVVDGFK